MPNPASAGNVMVAFMLVLGLFILPGTSNTVGKQSQAEFPLRGSLADALCDVEVVAYAVDLHLYGLLHELTNTSYFSLMQINVEGKCRFWDGTGKKCNKTLPPVDGDSEDVEGGTVHLPKKKKACDLDLTGWKKIAPRVDKPPEGMLGGFQPPAAPAA